MKLSSITIEGMHNVIKKTYNFDDIVYLYGRNGVGKSTVLQAIQLALLGYIPGTNKTKEHIFRHANNHTMAVTAVISADDGSEIKIKRIWTGTSKTINSVVEITPEDYPIDTILSDLELPIFNFGEFVGMTANKLKDWFIDFLPSADGELNWEDLLKEKAEGFKVLDSTLIETVVAEANSYDGTSIENVRKLNEYLKAMLSVKKADLARQQSTIQSLIFYEDVELSESVESIKAKISDANDKKAAAIRYVAELEAYNRNVGQLEALNYTSEDDMNAKVSDLTAKIASIDAEGTVLSDKIDSANKALDICTDAQKESERVINQYNGEISTLTAAISGEGKCPYTNEACESLNNYRTQVQSRIDSLKSLIAEETDKLRNTETRIGEITKEIKDHSDKFNAMVAKITSYNSEIEQIGKEYATYTKLKASIGERPEMNEVDADVPRWDTIISQLLDKLTKVEANIKYNELIERLTDEKVILEQSIEIIKIWIKFTDANNLQTKLMVAPFEALANKMNTYLKTTFPGDVQAHFYLSEKANSFSFGIMRNEQYIPFDLLSSGEKCLYTIALMMCIVYESSAPLKLIMVDDLFDHLDDTNIDKTFEALSEVKGLQFILAGVKPCNVPNATHIVKEVI